MGRRAGVDWMREEPDSLVASVSCASQDAESCGTTIMICGDSLLEVPRTHSKRHSRDLSDVEVKPFSGQLCPKRAWSLFKATESGLELTPTSSWSAPSLLTHMDLCW